jgi:uncharacterized protein (TIGR00290 family)
MREICQRHGMRIEDPLLGVRPDEVVRMCIDVGIRAVIVAAARESFPPDLLGREIDAKMAEDLCRRDDVDACGENGEYHTLALDGPLFAYALTIVEGEILSGETHWMMEIDRVERTDAEA